MLTKRYINSKPRKCPPVKQEIPKQVVKEIEKLKVFNAAVTASGIFEEPKDKKLKKPRYY
jgi:hypothetical protein